MWVGTPSGVAFLKADRFVPVASVPYGIVLSFTDDSAGNVWVSHQEGLFHLFQERVVARIPWATLGRRQPASALLHDAVQGGLWLGFRDGGVAYFQDGQLRTSYSGVEGLGEGMVRGFYIDGHGTLWVPTEGGLSRIKDGHILTLTSQNGLPCNTVHWMMEDDAQSVWLYLSCGLVRVGRSELEAWTSHPKQTIQVTVFDSSDGVSSHRFPGAHNSVVAKSADGKLWFVRPGGVSVIDPRHLPTNTLPPPIHIEQITADRKTYQATSGLRLPPLIRDLQIDYTALSFVAPEKNRFRVMLEGRDRELAGRRHAATSVLHRPRSRHVPLPGRREQQQRRVERSGRHAGILDRAGVLPDAMVPGRDRGRPVLAALGGVSAATPSSRAAVQPHAGRARQRADAHRAGAARYAATKLPRIAAAVPDRVVPADERPAEAKEKLDGAIEHAAKAITEGRDAVQGLRASTVERNDLAVAIRTLGDELATHASADQPPTFSVAVEGETRDLHPIVRDEIYKIAAEALRNAFRHAHAGRVEVEIRYDTSNSDCACATMARGLVRQCSQARAWRATTVCAACRNVPR